LFGFEQVDFNILQSMQLASLFLIFGCLYVVAKIPGLARTPPMGWLAWQRFRCHTDCTQYKNECIDESLFTQMADSLVSDGYRDAGYTYVNIDDCWMERTRATDGKLYANKTRFPNGIEYLTKYMHDRNLKLGIYQDYGTSTCAKYPGFLSDNKNNIKLDVTTFAEWGIDMLKVDGCNSIVKSMATGYPEIGDAIDKSGRKITYSCSWPDYERLARMKVNYTHVAETCHLWRLYDDIEANFASISRIVDFMADNQETLSAVAGPDHWNDPDMIIIDAKSGINYEESKAQMALWSILAAPLLMSNDLRTMPPELKEILLNKEIIAVDQDPLGNQGKRIYIVNGVELWRRDLVDGIALVIFNHKESKPARMTVSFPQFGIPKSKVRDLYAKKDLGEMTEYVSPLIPVHGVIMLKLV
jgi:alpha-N-acetylgalactosaminidase